jgi:hypothetical protein
MSPDGRAHSQHDAHRAIRLVVMSPSVTEPSDLTFVHDGAQLFPAAVDRQTMGEVSSALSQIPPNQAGFRIHGIASLRPILNVPGSIGSLAASVLGDGCRPVRAILFDKTPETNWSLPWHQDRTIVVEERIEVEGFGPWTMKSGLCHVAPPFAILAAMATMRVHLDPVPESNAPLLIAPRSHRIGRVNETDIPEVVRRCGTAACLADRGDIWLYATPILHASEAAREPHHRRVLQVDFAIGDLPGGLRWLGV